MSHYTLEQIVMIHPLEAFVRDLSSKVSFRDVSDENVRLLTAVAALISPVFLAAVWRLFVRSIRTSSFRKRTIVYDLEDLGKPRPESKRIKGTAVICGGSIAGLWAARVCADHFEDVLIVEAESWLADEEGKTAPFDEKGNLIQSKRIHERTRVAQYLSLHFIQAINYRVAKILYPNIDEEIKKANGKIDISDAFAFCFGGRLLRRPKDQSTLQMYISRESYERILRGLTLSSSSRIRWLAGTVTDLNLAEDDPESISSVTVRTADNIEKRIPAALVIDCSGRSQIGFRYLKRLVGKAAELDPNGRYTSITREQLDDLREEYDSRTVCSSFRFTVPDDLRPKLPIPGGFDNAAWIYTNMPTPPSDRVYMAADRLEGNRFEIVFGSWGENYIPRQPSEILRYLRENQPLQTWPEWLLESIDLLLENEVPVQIQLSRYPLLSWIHYEKFPYIPHNFVAIGDAAMVVNPIYGQGNAKSVIGAVTLDSLLRSRKNIEKDYIPDGFSAKYCKAQVIRTRGMWESTKAVDYNFESTIPVKGEKHSDTWFKSKFGLLLVEVCVHDDYVSQKVWSVRNFSAPPSDLFHPLVLAKIFIFALKKWLGLKRG